MEQFTAEEVLELILKSQPEKSIGREVAIAYIKQFAINHVSAALNAAYTNGETWVDDDPQPFGGPFRGIVKESIIKAYPLENIK